MNRRYQSRMEGKYKVAILLLCTFFASLKVETHTLSLSEAEIRAKLKLLNKPAVKTIKSENGDIIDCVNIYEQPAFDHPKLKNHTIQSTPKFSQESQYSRTKMVSQTNFKVFQKWKQRGSCPKGTIPIRRILKEDLLRATSLDRFGLKPSRAFVNSKNTTKLSFSSLNNSYAVFPESHSGAHLTTTGGGNYIGTQASINVWNPKVELPNDLTTAQIWLKAGNGFDFESIEAGWMVNPGLYGDNKTRFFSYWTKDSYKSTGCFDLTCSGFVQTSTDVALGVAIEPISSKNGDQFDIHIDIYLDELQHWWLNLNNIVMGYWPVEILDSLKQSASLIQWGGQVFSTQVKKSPHTGTEMGSGYLAEGKFGNACFIRNIRTKDHSLKLKYPENVDVMSQEPNCYNVLNDMEAEEPTFYFGGPGRYSPNCL